MAKTTKVILTHEVGRFGGAGDVVEVKPGFARNYLLPRKLATPWSKGAQAQIDLMKAARAKRQIASMEDAHIIREKLAAGPVLIAAKAGANGKLFAAVSTAQISDAVAQQRGVNVDRRKIVIDTPIKNLGTFRVNALLFEEVIGTIEINVTAVK